MYILQAKKEIFSVKQQRLLLAQDEYQNLSDTLTGWKSSRTSCKYKIQVLVQGARGVGGGGSDIVCKATEAIAGPG